MFLNENFQTEIYLELFADIQNLLNNFVNFRQLCGSSSSKAIKNFDNRRDNACIEKIC